MSKIYRQSATFECMYVTDDTFDAPHPDEGHMTGMTFHPDTRTVELDSPCHDDERIAVVGDVIIRHGTDGSGAWDAIWKADAFERNYERVYTRPWAALSSDGRVVCLFCGRGQRDASYPQGTCDECAPLADELSALRAAQPLTRGRT